MRNPVLPIALLLVTAFMIAGAFVPFRKCGACGGFVIETPPRPVLPLDCPDCADRGKIPLFQSWRRPRVAEPVAEILKCLADEQAPVAFEKLNLLVRNDGKAADAFLAGSAMLFQPRFIDAEGKTYLVLIMGALTKSPSGTTFTAVLLTPDGHALDRLLVTANAPHPQLAKTIHVERDGTGIAIRWTTTRPLTAQVNTVKLDPWHRPGRELFLMDDEAVLRLRLREDRFEIVTPEVGK
jgi:hypothetical protein